MIKKILKIIFLVWLFKKLFGKKKEAVCPKCKGKLFRYSNYQERLVNCNHMEG